mmetsp:Transcript_29192/g.61444  ORF Transcript_29192/g.61444 Transcript_29192/m.61444 type:complete len:80 (-) Transcript_29192:1053-1292(-)
MLYGNRVLLLLKQYARMLSYASAGNRYRNNRDFLQLLFPGGVLVAFNEMRSSSTNTHEDFKPTKDPERDSILDDMKNIS